MNFLHKKANCLSVSEKSGIKELWKEAFGDTESFIDFMLDGALSDGYFFAAKENDTLCSMFFLIGIECKTYDTATCGAYIYAVATKKELRGKGIFPKLFSYATQFLKDFGASFVLCKPSGEKLFDYYAKFGFEKVCFFKTEQIKPQKNGYNFKETLVSDKLYSKYLENLDKSTSELVKSPSVFFGSLECALSEPGYKLFEFESGFAVGNVEKKHIMYICAPKGEFVSAARALTDYFGSEGSVTVYSAFPKDGSPYACALFFGKDAHEIHCPLLFE